MSFLSMQATNSCSAIRNIVRENLATMVYQAMRRSREKLLEKPLERHCNWTRALALFVAYQKKLFLALKFYLANFRSLS
jgi:hypothetical protein